MAISEFASGTRASDSTEWSLTTNTSYDTGDAQTTDGVFQFFLDVSDMVAGDQLQIKVYEKVRSSDTQRLVNDPVILTGVQASPIWASFSLILLHGWDVTIKTLAGGTITVNWSIRQVA